MSNHKTSVNIIFCGTSDFGLPALQALIKDSFFNVKAIITQPDKQSGRGHEINILPIKKEAPANNIPLLQPADINLAFQEIKLLQPDIAVVIAYAQLIPEAILKIPALGFVNVHASLLPRYRGAAPMQAAILNNDNKTGVTIIKITPKLDAGPIITQAEIELKPDETTTTLNKKLSLLSAHILPTALKQYISGNIIPQAQDNNKASYANKITKADGLIDFNKPALAVERFIRAMNPWPGAYIYTADKKITIKLIKAASQPIRTNSCQPGQFFLHYGKLALQCAQHALLIEKLQPADKKIMSANDFINGYGKYVKH